MRHNTDLKSEFKNWDESAFNYIASGDTKIKTLHFVQGANGLIK